MISSFPGPIELQGTAQGTLLYLGLYSFVLIPFQSFSKFYLLAQKKKDGNKDKKINLRTVKYYNSQDVLALCGDRTIGNFLEQALCFLPLLWIHAIFVDPTASWNLCLAYTTSRALYPVVFLEAGKRKMPLLVLLSTVPGYLICGHLCFQVLKAVKK